MIKKLDQMINEVCLEKQKLSEARNFDEATEILTNIKNIEHIIILMIKETLKNDQEEINPNSFTLGQN